MYTAIGFPADNKFILNKVISSSLFPFCATISSTQKQKTSLVAHKTKFSEDFLRCATF